MDLAGILVGLDAIVWQADPDERRMTYVNDACLALSGRDAGAWLSAPDFGSAFIDAADREQVERMQAVFDDVNRASFAGRLPRVPIHLSRKMRRRNGHFSSHPLEIVISWRLCAHGAPGEAEETMRHEMIHLWQYVEGLPVDHGPVFRRAAHRLNVHPRATRPVRWKAG